MSSTRTTPTEKQPPAGRTTRDGYYQADSAPPKHQAE